jgi:hypothetical protein
MNRPEALQEAFVAWVSGTEKTLGRTSVFSKPARKMRLGFDQTTNASPHRAAIVPGFSSSTR